MSENKEKPIEGEVVDETQLATVSENTAITTETADDLQEKIGMFSAKRQVVVDYIKANFTKDVDYGSTDPRCPKPTLKKPGAEKICRLFDTRPIWTKDTDTWEMLGNPHGVVCFKCEIVNAAGKVLGEGRGAEKVGNKSRDHNKAIKNAEKCALVDAALYTFCLSEMFTQDGYTPDPMPQPDADPNKAHSPTRAQRAEPEPQEDVAKQIATRAKAFRVAFEAQYPNSDMVQWCIDATGATFDPKSKADWTLPILDQLEAAFAQIPGGAK